MKQQRTVMKVKRRSWHLWCAGLTLVLTITLVGLISPRSMMYRLSNLAQSDTGFSHTYLMFSKSEPGKGYVVNRHDSTIRRSHKKLPGGKWDVFRIGGEVDKPLSGIWLVQSKRKGKGTVFFVPVADVKDWTYPFLYRFVRTHREGVDLPNVEWSRLFINRIYQGLYLKVGLPFDLRKKDGGSGILREILTIQDNRLTYVNTRFDDVPGLYISSLASGSFLKLTPTPPALAWLSQRCPTEGLTLLMSNQPDHAVSLLPLPISLPGLFEAKNGRVPASIEDDRFREWNAKAQRLDPSDVPPFSDRELAALEIEFEQYADSFRGEMRIDAEFHQTVANLRTELPKRQAAVADLQLSLGRL